MLMLPERYPMTGTFALSGATLIDGLGGAPKPNTTVLVRDGVFVEIGPTAVVTLPDGLDVIDATGRYLLPGYINGNIHLLDGIMMMGIGGVEYLARYEGSFVEVIEEGTQLTLRNGVTTVFDTWNALEPTLAARDRINGGITVGSRIFAAGNIVGMGGPFSADFNQRARQSISPTFANRLDALFEAGVGYQLALLPEVEIRAALREYIARGVDMVKLAISDHLVPTIGPDRTYLTFPEKIIRMMAEETHAAGLPLLSHTMSIHALQIAADVDTDVMIHPTWTGMQTVPDALIQEITDKRIGVGIQPMTDDYSARLLAAGNGWGMLNGEPHVISERKFIEAGANLVVTTDAGCTSQDVLADLGESLLEDRPWTLGEDHFAWIKALRSRGLTPMAAIQALTHNVAEAYNKLDQFGSVEVGKVADIVLLNSDPLKDTENLRDIADVYKAGVKVDRESLPVKKIVTAPAGTPIPR